MTNDVVSLAHCFLFNTARTRDLLLPRRFAGPPPSAPTARPQISLGQRPRECIANAARAESPVHPTARRHSPRHERRRSDESRHWRSGLCVPMTWAVGPGWYEPGLWPIIFAMPQSLSLVVIPDRDRVLTIDTFISAWPSQAISP